MSDELKNKKVKKQKGPIRTGAVLPFIIFVAVVTVFNIFFLDNIVKNSMEYIGQKANGAEVNISQVNIGLTDLSFKVLKMEFTDPEKPDFNRFEIGEISFKALWDGVLRAKLVVNKAFLRDIKAKTKRSFTGYVVPEEEKKTAFTAEVLEKTQKEFAGNVLGDIASLITGTSVTKGMRVEDNLESKKKYEELSTQVDERAKEMDQAFKSLPNKDQLEDLKKRFEKIKWNDIGNITKAPKVLADIDQLKKDVDDTKEKIERANKLVNQNVKFINEGQKEIQTLVKKDIEGVQKRLKLPTLDTKTIAKLLFGNQVLDKIQTAERLHAQIKDYLPPKKTKEQKEASKPDYTKHPRGKGLDYQFVKTKSYPPVWIQKVIIDSQNDQGKVSGEINDITNNQKIVGKPTTLKIQADLVKENLRDIVITGSFDHRDISKDSVDMTIGSYPVSNKALSKSKSAKLIIDKARGEAVFNVTFIESILSFKATNYYKEIVYEYDAESDTMKEVLGAIANDTKVISMQATAKGKINDLNWDIRTNLASAIQKSVGNLIQNKINKAKADIENEINKSLSGSKSQLNSKLASFKNEYESKLNKQKSQFDNFKDQIDDRRKKEEKKAKSSLEDKAKKLFKGIKF